jgi:hypothetical protein
LVSSLQPATNTATPFEEQTVNYTNWTLDTESVRFPPKCTILPQSRLGAPTPPLGMPTIINHPLGRPPPLGRPHPLWDTPTPIDHQLGRPLTQPRPATDMCTSARHLLSEIPLTVGALKHSVKNVCTSARHIYCLRSPFTAGALKHLVKNVCTSARHLYCLRSPYCRGSETFTEERVHFS